MFWKTVHVGNVIFGLVSIRIYELKYYAPSQRHSESNIDIDV